MLTLLVMTTMASLAAATLTRTYCPYFQDCPKYSVVKSTKEYEERVYEAAKWTSTTINGTDWNPAVRTGLGKLIQYISGKNQQQANIPMTHPVITKVQTAKERTNFTVSFFVPFADQANPIKPTDPTVFTQPFAQMTAFVRSFSGYAWFEDYSNNSKALAESLDNAAVSYHKEFYYTVVYNSPFQPIGRHNEVWYIKTD